MKLEFVYGYIDLALYIPNFLLALKDDLSSQLNFLLVCFDSSTEHNSEKDPKFSSFLTDLKIKFDYRPEGIWIKGHEIKKVIEEDSLIVPFSALYIFDQTISQCEKPNYSKTSEKEQFSHTIPQDLIQEMTRLQAKSFLADGIGFNYLFESNFFMRLDFIEEWLREEIEKTKHVLCGNQ
jgi:hypothetical protein